MFDSGQFLASLLLLATLCSCNGQMCVENLENVENIIRRNYLNWYRNMVTNCPQNLDEVRNRPNDVDRCNVKLILLAIEENLSTDDDVTTLMPLTDDSCDKPSTSQLAEQCQTSNVNDIVQDELSNVPDSCTSFSKCQNEDNWYEKLTLQCPGRLNVIRNRKLTPNEWNECSLKTIVLELDKQASDSNDSDDSDDYDDSEDFDDSSDSNDSDDYNDSDDFDDSVDSNYSDDYDDSDDFDDSDDSDDSDGSEDSGDFNDSDDSDDSDVCDVCDESAENDVVDRNEVLDCNNPVVTELLNRPANCRLSDLNITDPCSRTEDCIRFQTEFKTDLEYLQETFGGNFLPAAIDLIQKCPRTTILDHIDPKACSIETRSTIERLLDNFKSELYPDFDLNDLEQVVSDEPMADYCDPFSMNIFADLIDLFWRIDGCRTDSFTLEQNCNVHEELNEIPEATCELPPKLNEIRTMINTNFDWFRMVSEQCGADRFKSIQGRQSSVSSAHACNTKNLLDEFDKVMDTLQISNVNQFLGNPDVLVDQKTCETDDEEVDELVEGVRALADQCRQYHYAYYEFGTDSETICGTSSECTFTKQHMQRLVNEIKPETLDSYLSGLNDGSAQNETGLFDNSYCSETAQGVIQNGLDYYRDNMKFEAETIEEFLQDENDCDAVVMRNLHYLVSMLIELDRCHYANA